MALSSATITYDLADMLGEDFDARRTRVYVTTNVASDTIVDTTGNQIRLGSGTSTPEDDGTGSVSVWVPGVGSNPASWQTTISVDYADPVSRSRKVRTFGPFTITASADLADLVEEQEVPAEYLTTVTEALESLRDEAEAAAALAVSLSGIDTTDEAIDAVINLPGSDTRATLDGFLDLKVDTADLPTILAAKADLVGGLVPTSQIPPLAVSETFTAASQAAMLALTAQRGDVAIRTDLTPQRMFILSSDSPTTLADWKPIVATGEVQSVNGYAGVVMLVKADVGLGSVENTSDANKPVSTAQQAALDLKLEPHTFAVTGTAIVATGKSRVYVEGSYTIVSVRASVNTAPTGASLICDVNKNGTTIYTTQANRPTIAAAGNTATANSPNVTTLVSGDYLTVDVDQVGSTVPGSDLTVTIRLRRTA